MNVIQLSIWDLSLAALLVLILAGISFVLNLKLEKRLLLAIIRSTLQLSLIGLILKYLFKLANPLLIASLAMIMLLVASYEVMARQQRRFVGIWGLGISVLSMGLSSFTVTLIALTIIIQPTPWYTPQYLIPLLGMLLGNTMNGIAISLENLTQRAWHERTQIEARLMLGQDWNEAISHLRNDALRAGLIPIINAMMVAGIVSLPGMMTGQILSGTPPMEAIKYQLLIMFLIASGTGFGAYAAVWLGSRHLFDARERLRLDRLRSK